MAHAPAGLRPRETKALSHAKPWATGRKYGVPRGFRAQSHHSWDKMGKAPSSFGLTSFFLQTMERKFHKPFLVPLLMKGHSVYLN